MNFIFFFNSLLLGVGLAMDAFSVSLANGLNEPGMKHKKACLIAGVFSFFQFLMPVIGWVCVHTVSEHFQLFEKLIPYIALLLLTFIGGKMLREGICGCSDDSCAVGFGSLIVQGVATSIDALSVGFTISSYNLREALLCCLIIAAATFIICLAGIFIGKKFGTALAGKSSVFGGIILIFIGIEIFLSGILH